MAAGAQKTPRFSVLMANYNNARYLGEAIRSVLNQTFQDWELLIIDDRSTDDSLQAIAPFLCDPRIRLCRNPVNIGYTATLKRLVAASRAAVLGTLDSDDALTDKALEIMYRAHRTHPRCSFIYSQFMVCDAALRPIATGCCRPMLPGRTNMRDNYASHFRTFKKQYYLMTSGYDEAVPYAEDRDLVLKMEEVGKLLFIDTILYYHRVLPHSQSHAADKRRIGFESLVLAKYKAYHRRRGTRSPMLTAGEMSTQLYYAAGLSFNSRIRRYIRGRRPEQAVDRVPSSFFWSHARQLGAFNLSGWVAFLRGFIGWHIGL